MKVRNLVLGMMLAANVLTAQGAVIATGGAAAAASIAAMASTNASIASSVTTNMMNSQNSVIVECLLKTEQIKKDGEWFGSMRPSLKKTIESSSCKWNKEAMEELNNTHYEFGKVKGIFEVSNGNHVMIELVEVNE